MTTAPFAGTPDGVSTISTHDAEQIERVNASGLTPAIFIHGLWPLPSSWDRWAALFEEAGYAVLTPGWPHDPATVTEANEHLETFAGKSIADIVDHFAGVIGALSIQPVVIGHSFGGLIAQIIAGRGLAAVLVAIDPAPFRGVLPLPISALKSASPVLGNPANRHRAVPLSYDQFRVGFANAVSEEEAHRLYETFAVPASGEPLFPGRGGELQPVDRGQGRQREPRPRPIADYLRREGSHRPAGDRQRLFKKQRRNGGVTEIAMIPGRGHALTIDDGWREVADTALAFVKRFA
jgi:non-heme chloroperoxidase